MKGLRPFLFYINTRMIELSILEQCVDHDELDVMSAQILNHKPVEYFDTEGVWKDAGLTANIHEWDWYSPDNTNIKTSLTKVLAPYLGTDFVMDKCHILDAKLPWQIHTDYISVCSTIPNEPQAVVIIPIEDADSCTIVFNEHATHSDNVKYRAENKPLKNPIKSEVWDQHLKHCWKHDQFYFSIDKFFPWRKGDVCIMDRQTFHASDSFNYNNVSHKRAIILFTCWP